MTNTYHTQVLLQADLSNKLNDLKRQASTQRLLLEALRTPGKGSQIWKAFRGAMTGVWQLESSTGSSTKASA
jgi:hypothetical protein